MNSNSLTEKNPLEEQFEKSISQAMGGNIVFPFSAKQEMSSMLDIIARGNENITTRLNTNQSVGVKSGFVAEEFHAETFNLDSLIKDKEARVITDQYKSEWNSFGKSGNDTADMLIVNQGQEIASVQAKYYKNAETTNQQMSQLTGKNTPKYEDIDILLGPSNQISPTDMSSSVRDHAEAAAWANDARGGNVVKTNAYRQTAQKVRDTIEYEGASSAKLTKEEANTLGSGDKAKLEKIEARYQSESTTKQMKSAASNAAAMTAIVSGSVNTMRYMYRVQKGQMSLDDAVWAIAKETVCSAADSAVKASANAGVQSLMVRYGAEKVVVGTLAKQGMKSLMRTNIVSIGVVCAIDAIKDLVKLGSGKITQEQFYERQGKNVLSTSSGVMGSSIGGVAASSFVSSIGVSGVAAKGLMLVGGLGGGLIAGLAMSLAIENGIEKPYKHLVSNTSALQEAMQELEYLSKSVYIGQVAFSQFVGKSIEIDSQTQGQMTKIDSAGKKALDAILKI